MAQSVRCTSYHVPGMFDVIPQTTSRVPVYRYTSSPLSPSQPYSPGTKTRRRTMSLFFNRFQDRKAPTVEVQCDETELQEALNKKAQAINAAKAVKIYFKSVPVSTWKSHSDGGVVIPVPEVWYVTATAFSRYFFHSLFLGFIWAQGRMR